MLQQGPAALPQQQQQHQQQLNPGWGLGTVSAAAALGGGTAAAAAGGGGGYGYPGGSWSAVGPLTAGMAGGAGGSPRKGASSPSPGGFGPAPVPGSPSGGSGSGPSGGPGGPSSRVVGVAGIMTREAAKTSQAAAHLAVAFQDLDNLMDMAAEMVKLAEKFRGVMGPDGAITLSPSSHSLTLAQGGAVPGSRGGGAGGLDSSGGSGSGDQLLLDSDTQLALIAMGITSPVTRASAGARYHQELARQLADFLAAPLAKAGGVLMLPDVYCLFNRARGTELVSPDDLLQACDAFTQVRPPGGRGLQGEGPSVWQPGWGNHQ